MRRARIRLQIAHAISAVFPMGHLSLPNVRRYVTRELLTHYNIRRDIPISDTDWFIAIQVCREERKTRQRDGYYPGELPSGIRLALIFEQVQSRPG